MPKLGLHSLAFTPLWDPAEADTLLPPITAHGVTVIETPLLDWRSYDAAGTRAAAERHGVQVMCSLGLPTEFDVPTMLDEVADYLEGALATAKDAGAPALTGVTYGSIGKTSGAPPTQAELDAIARLMARVARHARSLGMSVGLEPCNRYETHLLNTCAQTADMIERIGADNLFIHADTYHMNIEEPGMAEGFAGGRGHVGYVHLSESNRGVPGRGTMDWDGAFAGLKQIGFDETMTLESFVHLAPEIASGLAIWRPVAKRPLDVIEVGLPFLKDRAARAGIAFS